MSADLQLFKFEHQPMRVVLVDGEPWFVLSDLCRALGIANVGNVVARLHQDDIRQTDVTDTLSRCQLTKIVNESGMYEVVIRSDKKEAARFRRWVTHKVLPEIRRTGSYSHTPATNRQLPSKKELAQWVVEAEERAEAAESHAAAIQPSADAWDRLAEIGADYEVDVAAKILSRDSSINIGRNRLYVFMHDQDWIFRGRHNTWKAYQDQVDLERLKMRPGVEFWDKDRQEYRTGDPTILITPKGLAELRRLLGRPGQLELVTA